MLESQHLSNLGLLLTYEEINIITELRDERVELLIPNQCSFLSSIKCWPQKFSNRHKNAKSIGLLEIQKKLCEDKWGSIMYGLRGNDLAAKEFRLSRHKRNTLTDVALTTLEGIVSESPLAAMLEPFATTTFESLIDLFSKHGPLFRDDESDINLNLNYTAFENKKANEWCLLLKNDLDYSNFGSNLAIEAFSEMEHSIQNVQKVNLRPNSREEIIIAATCSETLSEKDCITIIENGAIETINEKLVADKMGNYLFSFDLVLPKTFQMAQRLNINNLGFYSKDKFYKLSIMDTNYIKYDSKVYSAQNENVFGMSRNFYTTNLLELDQCVTGLSINDATHCNYHEETAPLAPKFVKNMYGVIMFLIPTDIECELCSADKCRKIKPNGLIFNQLDNGEINCNDYQTLLQKVTDVGPHPLSLPAKLPKILSNTEIDVIPFYTIADAVNAIILVIILFAMVVCRVLIKHLRKQKFTRGPRPINIGDNELEGFTRTSRIDEGSLN